MKQIQLNKGYVAIVDDDDFDYLNQWTWLVRICKHTQYAYRAIWLKEQKNTKLIYMHREIMKPENSKQQVDHINHDGLDNQKINLRLCTKTQNNQNLKNLPNNKSGYKGVCWHKHTRKWRASIRCNGKKIELGTFKNIIDAVYAYNDAAIKYHGEFAKLNDVKKPKQTP